MFFLRLNILLRVLTHYITRTRTNGRNNQMKSYKRSVLDRNSYLATITMRRQTRADRQLDSCQFSVLDFNISLYNNTGFNCYKECYIINACLGHKNRYHLNRIITILITKDHNLKDCLRSDIVIIACLQGLARNTPDNATTLMKIGLSNFYQKLSKTLFFFTSISRTKQLLM